MNCKCQWNCVTFSSNTKLLCNSSTMFSPKTELALNFFDVCGFNTGVSDIFFHRKLKKVIIGVHILLALILTVFQFHLLVRYYSSLTMIEAISESLQYSTALFTFWMIIFDSICHRGAHKLFWQNLEQIDVCFCQQKNLKMQNYYMKFLEFFCATSFALLIRIESDTILHYSTFVAYILLYEICQLRVFYYLFCLEFVNFQLRTIENEVKTMQNALNFTSKQSTSYLLRISETSIFYSFESQRLKWIREYFFRIYEMINLLNETFGWSQVAAISFCFHLLLTEITWVYIHYMDMSWLYRFGLYHIHTYTLSLKIWENLFWIFIILKLF